jgi:hypothetical protein
VADTLTVDASVSGTGAVGDPYILSSDVRVSPDPDNAITIDAGGLRVTCADIAVCVPPTPVLALDTATVDTTVGGAGTGGDPWVVSSQVRVSAATDNLVVIEPDGIRVSCADIVAECLDDLPPTGVAVTDTPTLDLALTGTGAAGDPWTISGDVEVSAAVGNALVINPDGLFAGPAPVNVLCGLTGDGTLATPLAINAPAWDLACPEDNATAVYCGADGVIKAAPPALVDTLTTLNAPLSDIPVDGFAAPSTTVAQTDNDVITLTNPDLCHDMVYTLDFGGLIRLDGTPLDVIDSTPAQGSASIRGEYEVSINGGAPTPWARYRAVSYDQEIDSITVAGGESFVAIPAITVPPGGTAVINTRLVIIIGTGSNVFERVIYVPPGIRAFGVSDVA